MGMQAAKEVRGTVKKAKKREQRPHFVTVLVLMVLLTVMAIELVQVYGKLHAARSEQTAVIAQMQQRKQENEALESDLAKADDEEFIKALARNQLGMLDPGGRIFIDGNNGNG